MSTPVEITWLLAAVAKGDADAFERLYAASCAKVYGVVLRIVRRQDLAADVMEEVLSGNLAPRRRIRSRACDADRLDGRDRPQPGDRSSRASCRKAGSDAEPDAADDEGPGTVPRHQLTDALKRLLTCIGRLEPDRQRMLLLAYYGAFTPRPALGQARHAGQSAAGVAAAQPARSRAVSRPMSETGDTDALAAEFVLGTLDGPERAQAQALLGVDQPFAAKVRLLGAPARRAAPDGRAGRARSRDLAAHQGQGAGDASGRRRRHRSRRPPRRRSPRSSASTPGAAPPTAVAADARNGALRRRAHVRRKRRSPLPVDGGRAGLDG